MDENLKKIIENARQKVAEEKSNDEASNPTQVKKLYSKSPPYITVGNGLATKQYPADLSIDAFEVFNDLSRAQRGLFIKFKNILVKQNFDNWIAKNTVANPNIVYLSGTEDHDNIRAEMSKNRNGTNLEKKGVLKKIKNNVYMLNPFIFIPANNFGSIAKAWDELPSKKSKLLDEAKTEHKPTILRL